MRIDEETRELARVYRAKHHLSQTAMGELLGISRNSYQRFEIGRGDLSPANLARLRQLVAPAAPAPSAALSDSAPRETTDELCRALAHELKGVVDMLLDGSIGTQTKANRLYSFCVGFIKSQGGRVVPRGDE